MKVEYWDWITREMIQVHRKTRVFLFGDNIAQTGFGGQAKEMRGEPNSIGIPTKNLPSMRQSAFFSDEEFEIQKRAIDIAFAKIPKDKIIVIPEDGIGTGLAKMEVYAPKTFAYLQQKLKDLENE